MELQEVSEERPIMRWNGSIMAPNGPSRKMPWLF